jgi:hypothetical protein
LRAALNLLPTFTSRIGLRLDASVLEGPPFAIAPRRIGN